MHPPRPFFAAILAVIAVPAQAVVLYQTDDFSSGTAGWGGSRFSPPPTVVNGGPAGPTDSFLQISAASFHLGTKNTSGWTGDFLSAGIDTLEFDATALGSTAVDLRVLLFGPGGAFATSKLEPLAIGSGWQHLTFSIAPADLLYVPPGASGIAGTQVPADTLSDVDTLLIRHDTTVPTLIGNHPPHLTTEIGLDNILAVPEPAGSLLTALASLSFLGRRRS